ncbi:DUF6300 family protein [Streptomyces sp. NPDC021562]|uniref:DUF6300 family protein n=1 Tax=Streptomyces sp. NPDC021562 TaxID=3155121 RepID=UPI0033E2836B
MHPDGSFHRLSNWDGRYDGYTQEELARYCSSPPPSTERWTCSRCEGDLTLYWRSLFGPGVPLELCPACDADRSAAAAFLAWHQDPDRDPEAVQQLFEAWEEEIMHARGWVRLRPPEAPVSPPLPPGLTPRGRG